MAEKGKTYLMEEAGESEIDWLSNGDRKLLDYFDQVHSLSGMWRNRRVKFWIWFWIIVQGAWTTVYFYSVPFLIEHLDLFAHLIHHAVIGLSDLMYIDLLANRKDYVKSLAEGLTKTYNYGSPKLKNYHKKLLSERLKNKDSFAATFLTLTAVSLFIYLEVFYILEATLLKSYETMYPIHLPFDISHPASYAAVVFMQKLTIFLTVIMVRGVCAILYAPYSHLILEMDVLIYAVKHIDDLVGEKVLEVNAKTVFDSKQTSAQAYQFYCYHFAKHHECIRRYFYNMKKACSLLIFMLLLVGLICFACVGITSLSFAYMSVVIRRPFSQDNLGVKLKFVLIMVLQVIVIYGLCWVGEDISSKAEELRMELGCVHWWLMPKKCHSIIITMLLGCRIPMLLTTPFNQVANRQGFKDMTSNSYSCFNLMYQMKFK